MVWLGFHWMVLPMVSPGVSHTVAFRWQPWLDIRGSFFTHVSGISVFPMWLLSQQGSKVLSCGAEGFKREESEVASLLKVWDQKSQNVSCAIFSWSKPGTRPVLIQGQEKDFIS